MRLILFYLHEPRTEKDLDFENNPYTFIDLESKGQKKLM